MVLRMEEQTRIENPRLYDTWVVDELRHLLTVVGAEACSDPHRMDFFEIENGDHTFYIHISPVNGSVVLLAMWLGQRDQSYAGAAHQAAY